MSIFPGLTTTDFFTDLQHCSQSPSQHWAQDPPQQSLHDLST